MRLDKALLKRGLVASRSRAQELIRAGAVEVDGVVSRKAAMIVADGARLGVVGEVNPYVSRAALKLVHGLGFFGFDPAGKTGLDVGASTGGFTQVMLERGAKRMVALDVGHDQLHPSLCSDPRVVNMEGVNAKNLAPDALPGLDFVVCDVSFISLTKALVVPLSLAKPGAFLVALIKPQFEVGPGKVGKGGIVKDEAARAQARADIRVFIEDQGWDVDGETVSPITGSDGNVEYLIGARKRDVV